MTTDTIVARIVADKRIEVEARKEKEPLDALKRRQDRISARNEDRGATLRDIDRR